jgi:hypothetical protein
MRKDSTPQVETREISDSDLDNVSGGVSVSGGVTVDGLDTLVNEAACALPSLPVGQVVGLVSGATSTLSGVTGLAGL